MWPFSLEQPSTICPFSHLGCHLQKTSQNIPFWLGLPPPPRRNRCALLPVDVTRNDFNDFAFEYRSGCRATEPGYTRDIGAIEIWLIDWFDWISVNGMGVIEQALSGDKQAVLHKDYLSSQIHSWGTMAWSLDLIRFGDLGFIFKVKMQRFVKTLCKQLAS